MSYEPTLIIRKAQLDKYEQLLEGEQYDHDEDTASVAKFLLGVIAYEAIQFDDLKLVLCQPEFTSFNSAIRDKLNDLKVEFRTDN